MRNGNLEFLTLSLAAALAINGCASQPEHKKTADKPSAPAQTEELNPVYEPASVAIFAGHVEQPRQGLKDVQGSTSASGLKEYLYNDGLVSNFHSSREIKYETIFARDNIPINKRPEFAQKLGAKAYIEIHHDSAQQEDIDAAKLSGDWSQMSGFSAFYSPTNKFSAESFNLASLIGKELVEAGFNPNQYHAKDIKGERFKIADSIHGVYESVDYTNSRQKDRLFVLGHAQMPAVVVEAGVIVNPSEENSIRGEKTRKKFAASIDKALAKYFTENKIRKGDYGNNR